MVYAHSVSLIHKMNAKLRMYTTADFMQNSWIIFTAACRGRPWQFCEVESFALHRMFKRTIYVCVCACISYMIEGTGERCNTQS